MTASSGFCWHILSAQRAALIGRVARGGEQHCLRTAMLFVFGRGSSQVIPVSSPPHAVLGIPVIAGVQLVLPISLCLWLGL